MSNPYIPFDPPGDTTNRTAKMLSQRTKPIVNGEPVPPGGSGKIIIPPEDLTFRAASRWGMRLNAQPAADKVYFTYQRRKYNSRAYNKIRIGVDVYVAGAAGSRLRVQWTATPFDDASWAEAGKGGVPVFVNIDAVGPWVSGLMDSHLSSRVDVWWRVIGSHGDAVASPVIGIVYVQFDLGEELPRTRWFWRNFAPSITPTPVPETLEELYTFWGCVARTYTTWTTPTPESVRTSARIFKREKGSRISGVSFGTTCPDDIFNHAGPVLVIVGAPMLAQTIPAFDYQTAWSGVGGGGNAACHLALQLHVYRDDTEEFVYSSPVVGGGAKWFRYIPKAHISSLPMDEMTILAGDRFVLHGSLALEVTCGLASTDGVGAQINYNGDVLPSADFEDATEYSAWTASYTDFPAGVLYETEDA